MAATTAIGQHLLLHVFHARTFRSEVIGFHESRDASNAVAGDPEALGLLNLSHRSREIRPLEIVDESGRAFRPDRSAVISGGYPLDRFLLIYARRGADGRLEPAARDFLAFVLSNGGQAIIGSGRKGYIPLNREERAAERAKLQ